MCSQTLKYYISVPQILKLSGSWVKTNVSHLVIKIECHLILMSFISDFTAIQYHMNTICITWVWLKNGMKTTLFSSSWVFQTLMTTRTSSTMETSRKKQRRTISKWVLANNVLSEVNRPSTGRSIASFPLIFPPNHLHISTVLWYALCLCLAHSHTRTTAYYTARFHVAKKSILTRRPMSFLFYSANRCLKKYGNLFRILLVLV